MNIRAYCSGDGGRVELGELARSLGLKIALALPGARRQDFLLMGSYFTNLERDGDMHLRTAIPNGKAGGERESDPYGTRTRVAGVKGRSPRPLDEGAQFGSCHQVGDRYMGIQLREESRQGLIKLVR